MSFYRILYDVKLKICFYVCVHIGGGGGGVIKYVFSGVLN